jgi:hypothetical protein
MPGTRENGEALHLVLSCIGRNNWLNMRSWTWKLQNAVGDVEALAQVKLMNDHDISRGHPPLTYKRYVQVLLSACSTYDSQRSSSDPKKRVVYQSELDLEPNPYFDNDYYDYGVDTDFTDILAYATDTTRFVSKSGSSNQSSNRFSLFQVD